MEVKDFVVSFSELSAYRECPLKWFYSNILRLPSDVGEELLFGQSIHKSIEDILSKKLYSRKSMWSMVFKSNLNNELNKITDKSFIERFKVARLQYVFEKQGGELLMYLDILERFKEYEVLHIEYKINKVPIFQGKNLNFLFKGFIDLVLKHKTSGRILIVDWKTSKKKWDIKKKLKDNEDHFEQLALYKYFYSKLENVPIDMIDLKFYNLPREEPNEQLPYSGILNESFIEYIVDKLITTCKQIDKVDFMKLDKARFLRKKTFCHRCRYNIDEMCNEHEEFQFVS